MKPILIALCLSFAGCATTSWSDSLSAVYHSPIARQVASTALQIALGSAMDRFGNNAGKSDWLSSAATMVREGMEDYQRVNASQVQSVIIQSTPVRQDQGYFELAKKVAAIYQAAPGTPAQKAEEVAKGLDIAAAKAK
jgi:hypothetical protein